MESNFHSDPSLRFLADPFAPQRSQDDVELFSRSKSIEEILNSLGGCRNAGGNRQTMADCLGPSQTEKPCIEHEIIKSDLEIPSKLSALIELAETPEKNEELAKSSIPVPIRGAFQCDPDLYDLYSIEQRCEDGLQVIEKCLETEQPLKPNLETSARSQKFDHTKVFWAAPNQVILVRRQDGYESIDLSCFELSQASFQGNRIVVQVNQNQQFEIEYVGVPLAVFANGETIRLADNDSEY